MNRNVTLRLKGTTLGEQQDITEAVHAAEYFYRNGAHYLLYEEIDERGVPLKKRMKLRDGRLELSGGNEMCFEENASHECRYRTPYGELPLTIRTRQIAVCETDGRMEIVLRYTLENAGELISENQMDIVICEN